MEFFQKVPWHIPTPAPLPVDLGTKHVRPSARYTEREHGANGSFTRQASCKATLRVKRQRYDTVL